LGLRRALACAMDAMDARTSGMPAALSSTNSHLEDKTVRPLRGPECVRVLCSFGFAVYGSTPIRIGLSRAGRKVLVPRHGPLSDDELRTILGVAGIEEREFEQACDEHTGRRDSGIRAVATSMSPPARASWWGELRRVLGRGAARRAG
jgi:hypothetical protein